MKNIEKAFVTLALFLLITTWILSVYVFAEQSMNILSQRAQIYNTAPIVPQNTLIYPSGTSSGSTEKSAITAPSSFDAGSMGATSNSLTLPLTSETAPSSGSATDANPTINNIYAPSTAQSPDESLKPTGRFIYPSAGSSISAKVEIRFEIYDSTSVEFYIRKIESSTEMYLGFPRISANNIWIYYWDSASIPNGNYYIIPYISNKYGRYAGSKVYITVNNQVQQSTAQVTQLKEQITSAQNSIQDQESKLVQTQNQISASVVEKTQEISSEANAVLPSDKVSAVREELDALSLKIINNAGISQKHELDKSNQEIAVQAKEIADFIASSSGDNVKTEGIKAKIGSFISDSVGQLNNYFSEKQKLEKTEKELALKDSDSDGLPDQKEIGLKTDPFNPDTDGDGFLDGTEVKLGYDPLVISPADKVTYQSPKELQALVSEAYQVEKVELVESPQNKSEKVLKIKGKAPANSFVMIYIYSTPTIVVAKADANGNWEYTLDKPLADGRHTVYASVTNNEGDIEKVSKAFDFAKAEDKIIKLLMPAEGAIESPAQNLNRVFVIMIAIAVALAVVFVILVLGIYLSQHNK
ncbi:MAG: Ig-like domain-containing protein [Candidatus Nealsonbacteria bacterium]|nr:Ig-like domain-containing protein [Candidatus Nealsonbacteria bacterium]